jgi:hypothetical protein
MGRRVGMTTLPPSVSRMSENVEASTSRNPKGLRGLYRDSFAFTFYICSERRTCLHKHEKRIKSIEGTTNSIECRFHVMNDTGSRTNLQFCVYIPTLSQYPSSCSVKLDDCERYGRAISMDRMDVAPGSRLEPDTLLHRKHVC